MNNGGYLMDIEKLIRKGKSFSSGRESIEDELIQDLTTALSTLQAENAEMQKQLNEFSEFLCHITGGLLSKTNYTAQKMVAAAEDYQQRVCDDCDLRSELEQVKRENSRLKEILHGMEKN